MNIKSGKIQQQPQQPAKDPSNGPDVGLVSVLLNWRAPANSHHFSSHLIPGVSKTYSQVRGALLRLSFLPINISIFSVKHLLNGMNWCVYSSLCIELASFLISSCTDR